MGDGKGNFGRAIDIGSFIGDVMRQTQAVDVNNDGALDLFFASDFRVVWMKGIPNSSFYQGPRGDFSTLVKNPDDTWTRTFKNGTVVHFDDQGRQTSTVDRNGLTTTIAYNLDDQVESITDPANLVTTFSYTNGLLSSITDPASRSTLFDHDANGNLTRITDPDNTERTFEYDANHRLISQTNERNFTSTYDYNFAGRNIRADRADSSFSELSPQETAVLPDPASGLGTEANPLPAQLTADVMASFKDGNQNETKMALGFFSAATMAEDALNQTTEIERNLDNQPTRIVNPRGAVSTFTYDDLGNLLESTNEAISATTTFVYEPIFHQVTSVTDPENHTTTMAYDANGNLTLTTDANLTETGMEYTDANCPGLVTKITSADGLPEEAVTLFTYDPATCNLLTVTNPLGDVSSFTYDTAGNVQTFTDEENRLTQFDYDDMNRLTQVTDALLQNTFFEYDDLGNLTKVTDP